MDATCDGNCHGDAAENTGLQSGRTINIQIAQLGGESLSFETHLSATVSDIKALIHVQLGHPPRVQTLCLDTTIFTDSNALLKDMGVDDGSLLTLTLSNEPLGQSLLTEPNGKMVALSRQGEPTEVLNEFQLMSLQAAWKSGRTLLCPDDVDGNPWGDLGAWSIDLFWTTRSNKCRYEYWSTAPGDNELGALMRIDSDSVTCIGSGSDDGLCVFNGFTHDRVAMQLVREGWPRFQRDETEEETVEEETVRDMNCKAEAMKAINAMKKLNPQAKKKAMKKLQTTVHREVNNIIAMKASGGFFSAATETEGCLVGTAPASGIGLFDTTPATWSGIFGAASSTGLLGDATTDGGFVAATATTSGGLSGATLATTGGSLFGDATTGGGLFCGASATTGGSLFTSSATTGGGLFGDVTTGGSIFVEPPPTTGGGLFGAASDTTSGGLFGNATTGGDVFGAAPSTTGGLLFGPAPVAAGAGSSSFSSVGTSSKQEDCKVQ